MLIFLKTYFSGLVAILNPLHKKVFRNADIQKTRKDQIKTLQK